MLLSLAPRRGLEPRTPRLTAACSTIELSGTAFKFRRETLKAQPHRRGAAAPVPLPSQPHDWPLVEEPGDVDAEPFGYADGNTEVREEEFAGVRTGS